MEMNWGKRCWQRVVVSGTGNGVLVYYGRVRLQAKLVSRLPWLICRTTLGLLMTRTFFTISPSFPLFFFS